jgi:hypothetical protein
MMHGREKSDSAIVAEKPTNKVVSATGGAGGAKGSKARFGHSAENACHRRWSAYGKFAVTHPRWEAVCGPTALRLGFFSLWTQSEPARLTEIGGLCMLLPIDSICPDMDLTLFERE